MTMSIETSTTLSEQLLAELARETHTTRRVLERVPNDKLTWMPHPTSRSLGALALHVAIVPGAIADLVSVPVRQVPTFTTPEPTSLSEILSGFDDSIANATQRLSEWSNADLAAQWTLAHGETTVMSMPRIDMVRAVMFNHWYHHRGQLTVYLRMLGVGIPSVYGPSADENPFG